jgi:hypothetical protein
MMQFMEQTQQTQKFMMEQTQQTQQTQKFMMEQTQQTQQTQQFIMEAMTQMMKNGAVGNVTNNTDNSSNSHNVTNNTVNQRININFLNERCSDAMNIQEFVDQIEVQPEDLELLLKEERPNPNAVGKILIRELKRYGINERPIHCTDLKRKKIYIQQPEGFKKLEKLGDGDVRKERIDNNIPPTSQSYKSTWVEKSDDETAKILKNMMDKAGFMQRYEVKNAWFSLPPAEQLNTHRGRDLAMKAEKMDVDLYKDIYATCYREILEAVKVDSKSPFIFDDDTPTIS